MSTQAPTQTVKKQSKSLSTLLNRKPKLKVIGLLALPKKWIVGIKNKKKNKTKKIKKKKKRNK